MRKLVVLLVALAACGGGDDSIGPDERTSFSFPDPEGDTLGISALRNHDLRVTKGYVSDDSLSLTFEFANTISRGSAEDGNSLHGYIELDVDEDPRTGYVPITESYRPETGLGVEWAIILGEDDASTVILYDFGNNVDYAIPARFGDNYVTVRLSLDRIGAADGRLAMVGVVGNTDDATDVLPNTGVYLLRRTASVAARRASAPPFVVSRPRQAERARTKWPH